MHKETTLLGQICRDKRGQASFAIVSVIILIATTAAATYLARNQLRESEERKHLELLAEMENAISEVSRELSLCSAGRAQTLVSTWSEYPLNESKLSDSFSGALQEYIDSSFPRTWDAFEIEVANWSGGLFYIEYSTIDLVPNSKGGVAELEADGSRMEYEQLPPPSEEMLSETTANPYYVAIGNFTVDVSSRGTRLSRQSSFERPIISALPFLESKLRAFESASSGPVSDLEALVSSMLSTLCQLRVLEGYGQPMYSGGKNTSALLTEQDVYRAVSVGLLLEQVRLFRTVDSSFAKQIALACGGGEPGLAAVLASTGRALEPAELFLWFLGKTDLDIDPQLVVAQAAYSLADSMVVKLMDYMGLMGLLDAAQDLSSAIDDSIDSMIAFLTGEDKAATAVTSWIRKSLDSSCSNPELYVTMFSPQNDIDVYVPERTYYVQDLAGDLYPVWVGNVTVMADAEEYDLLESPNWALFHPEFKAGQSDFRGLLEDGLKRLAFDIAGMSQVDIGPACIDPTDRKDIASVAVRSMGQVSLTVDKAAVELMARDLPMFSAQYRLAESLSTFFGAHWADLFPREQILASMYLWITESVLSSARYPHIPDLVVPVDQQLRDIVQGDIAHDFAWGVNVDTDESLQQLSLAYLSRLADAMNSSVQKVDDRFAGPAVDAVANAIAYGTGAIPGMCELVEGLLTAFAKAIVSQETLSGHKRTMHMDTGRSFEFWTGNRSSATSSGRTVTESLSVSVEEGLPDLEVVPYDESKGYVSLASMFPTDAMLVQVRKPWQFDRSSQDYPNCHLTDLRNVSPVPYSTEWSVSVAGLLDLRLTSNSSSFRTLGSEQGPMSSTSVRIDLSFPVVVNSPWPLDGVAYNPTNTALEDGIEFARKFCDLVWEKLEPYVGWVKDILDRIWSFVSKVLETVSTYATRMVQTLYEAIQKTVETLQEYAKKIADSALARAVDAFLDITGRVELRISVHGFVIIVQTNLPDLLYRQGSDLLRLIVFTDRFGPGLTFGVRLARLSDGSFDILANSTVSAKGLTMKVAVDPLMHILRRFVEVHCTAKTWVLDLVAPEVEPYEKAEVSTSDIPGVGTFLSNIPLPALGLSASIEAGMRLKYSSPFPTDVVVNEFESNPQGEDAGKEWVELYNPLTTPKSLDGWKLSTIHGRSAAIELDGAIPANGLRVFKFPETSIDNGYSDDPFNNGDAVVLLDAAGAVVDVTPVLRDTDNDMRTNQRGWDGGPRWVFQQGSYDSSNGVPVLLASSDFIAKALFEAFKQSFLETKLEEVTASLDFVILFSKRVLRNFIENLLSIVKEVIHEVIFYLKVTLKDASGSAGVGFRASFVITGEAIVDLLRWLIHTFATFVVNLGRASSPLAYPVFPQHFFAGLFLRFEVLFEVGLPNMVRLLGVAGDISRSFACAVVVSPNIPAIGKLVGRSWGNWSVELGAYLEGVPREFASGFLTKNTGKLIDFWIVKGSIRGV
ncbi:MAG TPA: lamin tail domain-containing protein [Thermoplasmata archaeon]